MNFKGVHALYSVTVQSRIQSFSTTSSGNKNQQADTTTTPATGLISNPSEKNCLIKGFLEISICV